MRLAFYDLDKTLLKVNSASGWVRRERALGHLSPKQAAVAGAWLLQYSLGFSTKETALKAAIASSRGVAAASMQQRVDAYFDDHLSHLFRPGAIAALDRDRDRGVPAILLTASSHFLAQRVVHALGLTGALCNVLEVDGNGQLTGQLTGPLCYGTGKLVLAQREARNRGITLAECAFYTDSVSDLPVLETVGFPHAVHPDLKLKRIARQRGWPILFWDKP